MDQDRKHPQAVHKLGVASEIPADAATNPVKGVMERLRHIVEITADRYVVGTIVELNGARWRVLRATACEPPFPEADVMTVSVPKVYFIDLEPASI